jgi:WD40 repeat protein
VVIGDQLGQISIYNQSSLSLIRSFQGHSDAIYRIKQSPFNANLVATCSWDSTVKIWNMSDLTLVRAYTENWSLDWLDADTLVSSDETDTLIKIWLLSTGETKRIINVTTNQIDCLILLNDKLHLALRGDNPFDIQIYNVNDGSLVSTLQGHEDFVNNLIQLDSDLLASSSQDETIRIWNLITNTLKFTLRGHNSPVVSLKQINFELLSSGSLDGIIQLWNLTDGQLVRTLSNHTGKIFWSLDLMNGRGTLVSGGKEDQTIKLWNWSTGECV